MEEVKKLIQRFRKSLADEPWEDQLGFSLILISTPLAYFFGVYWIIPDILEHQPWFLQCLGYGIPTISVLGIFANLYMLDLRNSSIRNRILQPPNPNELSEAPCKLDTETTTSTSSIPDISVEGDFVLLEKPESTASLRINNKDSNDLIQDKPSSSGKPEDTWRMCGICKIQVPPRAWHCKFCKSCILRRDHHCIYVKKCIGQHNLANFVGFLFYVSLGCSAACLFSFFDHLKNGDSPLWWYAWRTLNPPLGLPYDFAVQHILSSVVYMGALKTVGNFFYCVSLSARGETYREWHRTYRRDPNTQRTNMSYANLVEFLGPNPFYRIFWPFHSMPQTDPCMILLQKAD